MKTHTIRTFLRPALPKDIFTKQGFGTVIENRQIFFKEKNGMFHGPVRLVSKQPVNIFLPLTKEECDYYLELYDLMDKKRIFLVDPLEYDISSEIHLKVKQVEAHDILQSKSLIVHTAYFKKINNYLEGPFYIKKIDTYKNFYHLIKQEMMFVFDKASLIAVVPDLKVEKASKHDKINN